MYAVAHAVAHTCASPSAGSDPIDTPPIHTFSLHIIFSLKANQGEARMDAADGSGDAAGRHTPMQVEGGGGSELTAPDTALRIGGG